MPDESLTDVVITLVVVGVILLLGAYIGSTIVATAGLDSGGDGEYEFTQDAAKLDGTIFVDPISPADAGKNETVYDSRGNAIHLTGANDSYIQSTDDVELLNNTNWTVSTWASRNTTFTENRTVVGYDGQLVIYYNQKRGNYSAWHYDEGSRDSHEVTVNATDGTNNLANIIVTKNQSTLTIYFNNTQGTTANLSTSNTVSDPNASNWHGRLEEFRFVEQAWNSSQRSTHETNPIDPTPTNATGRVMFDEPYRADQLFFYASGRMSTSNATFKSGINSSEMTAASNLLQQSDYEFDDDSAQIRAVSGGELENAPVAYLDYDALNGDGVFGQGLIDGYGDALALGGIFLILVPLSLIFMRLHGMRGR